MKHKPLTTWERAYSNCRDANDAAVVTRLKTAIEKADADRSAERSASIAADDSERRGQFYSGQSVEVEVSLASLEDGTVEATGDLIADHWVELKMQAIEATRHDVFETGINYTRKQIELAAEGRLLGLVDGDEERRLCARVYGGQK